jgi:hypothetical protein
VAHSDFGTVNTFTCVSTCSKNCDWEMLFLLADDYFLMMSCIFRVAAVVMSQPTSNIMNSNVGTVSMKYIR